MHSRRPLLFVLLALAVAARLSPAQHDQEHRLLANKLAQQATEAFEKNDYAKAEQFLRRQLVLQPGNFVIMYNLGCALAMRGESEQAADFIVRAVEHGFTDLAHMERDPQLASVRDEPAIRGLRERWPQVLLAQAENNLKDAQRTFAKGYEVTRDEHLKVIYLSAFNPKSFEAVRAELTRIAEWSKAGLFPDLFDPEASRDDAWVVVVLPGKSDFTSWARASFGNDAVQGNSMIAGSYMHDQKRLVAMDLGATLRHEFLHALHWRVSTRKGQAHPLWILEGLGTLVEDFNLTDKGSLAPAISWRTNTAKRIEKINKLIPLARLSAMTHAQFAGQRPLANYAQARAFFLYLQDRGVLRDWFTDYERSFSDDRSGLASLERSLGRSHAEIDADFRAWVRLLPSVPEEIRPGMASLGVEVDAGAGEGPVIAAPPRRADGSRIDLRLGDVILAIDERPTRDLAELVRVLSGYEPGAEVTVSYRRGSLMREAAVTLLPAP